MYLQNPDKLKIILRYLLREYIFDLVYLQCTAVGQQWLTFQDHSSIDGHHSGLHTHHLHTILNQLHKRLNLVTNKYRSPSLPG